MIGQEQVNTSGRLRVDDHAGRMADDAPAGSGPECQQKKDNKDNPEDPVPNLHLVVILYCRLQFWGSLPIMEKEKSSKLSAPCKNGFGESLIRQEG
jgi:hypothetical protein